MWAKRGWARHGSFILSFFSFPFGLSAGRPAKRVGRSGHPESPLERAGWGGSPGFARRAGVRGGGGRSRSGAGRGPVGGLSRGPVCRPRRGGFFPRRRHIFALFGRNCKIRNTVVSALFLIRRGRAKGPTRMSSSAFSLAAPARPRPAPRAPPGGPPRAPGGPPRPRPAPPRAPAPPAPPAAPRAPAGSRAPARRPGGGGGRILSPRSWRPPRPLARIFAKLPTGGICPKNTKSAPV